MFKSSSSCVCRHSCVASLPESRHLMALHLVELRYWQTRMRWGFEGIWFWFHLYQLTPFWPPPLPMSADNSPSFTNECFLYKWVTLVLGFYWVEHDRKMMAEHNSVGGWGHNVATSMWLFGRSMTRGRYAVGAVV